MLREFSLKLLHFYISFCRNAALLQATGVECVIVNWNSKARSFKYRSVVGGYFQLRFYAVPSLLGNIHFQQYIYKPNFVSRSVLGKLLSRSNSLKLQLRSEKKSVEVSITELGFNGVSRSCKWQW